jgi:lipopolysaccharide exporter
MTQMTAEASNAASAQPDAPDARSNQELTAATGAGLRWMTFARLGTELLMLGSVVVLARLIPPAAFGMFAVVVIVQELAYSMPMEGIGSALVQRREIDREHLEGGLVLSLLMGLGLSLATAAAAFLVVRPIFGTETEKLVLLATPWFLIGAPYAVPVAVLRRRLDFRRLSVLDFSQTFVRIAVTIPLAIAGLDATALALGNMVGIAAGLVLALCWVRIPLPRWRPGAMRDLLGYGGPAALACVAWTGFRNGDYAIVGARLGTAQAGFYWRGYQLGVEYQRKISTVMTQMAFPVLARTTGPDQMHQLRSRMVQLLTVTLFPLLVLLVVLAPVMVPWVFGPEWQPAVLPSQILALGGAASLVIDAVGSVFMAMGRSRSLLGYGVAHFVVYVGAVLAVSSHGLAAVAVAASVVHAVFLAVAYRMLFPGEGRSVVSQLWSDVGAAIVACLGLAAVAVPLEWALRDAGAPVPVHIVLVGGISLLAYAGTLRVRSPSAWQDLARAVGRVVPLRPVRAAARKAQLSGEPA